MQRHPIIDRQVAFQRKSGIMCSATVRDVGRNAPNSKPGVVSTDICLVNLTGDAGTVIALKPLYALVANPGLLARSIPLELGQNLDYNEAQSEQLFTDPASFLSQKGIEVCGVIFDNLPAQVKSFPAFVVTQTCGTFHIRFLNHMCKLCLVT
jgi:hypothetical protein